MNAPSPTPPAMERGRTARPQPPFPGAGPEVKGPAAPGWRRCRLPYISRRPPQRLPLAASSWLTAVRWAPRRAPPGNKSARKAPLPPW